MPHLILILLCLRASEFFLGIIIFAPSPPFLKFEIIVPFLVRCHHAKARTQTLFLDNGTKFQPLNQSSCT
jgi:hypothetical protein